MSYSLDAILPRVDVLNLLRIQFERQIHAAVSVGSRVRPSLRDGSAAIGQTKPDILILAPGPINRGVEVSPTWPTARTRRFSNRSPTAWRSAWPSFGCWQAGVNAMTAILIQNGRVIDPSQDMDRATNLLIVDGRIAAYDAVADGRAEAIDAAGRIIAPGLIDMHVHLREPGFEEDETIETGTAAALAGGFTSVACIPNTDPPIDSQAAIEFVRDQAARAGHCNVFVIGCVSRDREGKELAEIGQLVEAGAVAFSDDGAPVADAELMRRAFEYCLMFDKPVLNHAEIRELTARA